MHSGLKSATLSQLAFSEESNPNFQWKQSQWDNTIMEINIEKKIIVLMKIKLNCK